MFVVSLAALLSAPALAQTAVLSPPKPADNGPSLAVTMNYLQDKLSGIGKVSFVTFYQNTTDNSNGSNIMTNEVSHAVANINPCRVTNHWKSTNGGATLMDIDAGIPLRDVIDITVKPFTQYQTELDASLGNPNFVTTSTNPALSALLVHRAHGVVNLFPFTDADAANRVAKAMVHAVELCGGGNKDPF
ncbi:MAG: hypothetical protein ABSC77_06010 [Terracidiphilus sp.]